MNAGRAVKKVEVRPPPAQAASASRVGPVGAAAARRGRAGAGTAYFWLGLSLLSAFLAQHLLGWKWPWLEAMQTNETYKQITGLVLMLYLAEQWRLSWLRMNDRLPQALQRLPRHRLTGALAPLFFYFHAHQPGHASLWLLTAVYFAAFSVGLFNCEVTGIRSRHLLNAWLIAHVSLSVLLPVLAGYHVYIAFAYN